LAAQSKNTNVEGPIKNAMAEGDQQTRLSRVHLKNASVGGPIENVNVEGPIEKRDG